MVTHARATPHGNSGVTRIEFTSSNNGVADVSVCYTVHGRYIPEEAVAEVFKTSLQCYLCGCKPAYVSPEEMSVRKIPEPVCEICLCSMGYESPVDSGAKAWGVYPVECVTWLRSAIH